jgi:chromosome segregation ATPase
MTIGDLGVLKRNGFQLPVAAGLCLTLAARAFADHQQEAGSAGSAQVALIGALVSGVWALVKAVNAIRGRRERSSILGLRMELGELRTKADQASADAAHTAGRVQSYDNQLMEIRSLQRSQGLELLKLERRLEERLEEWQAATQERLASIERTSTAMHQALVATNNAVQLIASRLAPAEGK